MNVAYRYITSVEASRANHSTIYPYVDWWSHQPTTAELHRPVTFPTKSVDTSSVVLVEGDFTTAFNNPSDRGCFDVVVTLFFIDTARNILTYIETIHRLLRPGKLDISSWSMPTLPTKPGISITTSLTEPSFQAGHG